jgi:hypothetical protein
MNTTAIGTNGIRTVGTIAPPGTAPIAGTVHGVRRTGTRGITTPAGRAGIARITRPVGRAGTAVTTGGGTGVGHPVVGALRGMDRKAAVRRGPRPVQRLHSPLPVARMLARRGPQRGQHRHSPMPEVRPTRRWPGQSSTRFTLIRLPTATFAGLDSSSCWTTVRTRRLQRPQRKNLPPRLAVDFSDE